MDSIDLNIENYSIGELEELLSLRTDYTINMIHVQKNELQNKVMGDANISFESREDINKFINNIGITLEAALNKNAQKKPPTEFSELKQNMKEVSGHFLIENPNNVDRYSQPATSGIASQSGAPPGIINPIKYKTIKKTINIDSRFRPNYYTTNSSDMQVDLPERIDNITKMSLTSLEIPLSFYTFSRGLGNNVMTVRYQHSGSDEHVDVPITIPDGNYQVAFVDDTGAKSIEVAINEALRAAIIGPDPNKPYHPALQYLRYSVDTSSCKSVFAMTTDFKKTFTPNDSNTANTQVLLGWGIIFNVNIDGELNPEAPLPLRLGWYLGFRTAAYEMIVNQITNDPGACASEGLCFPKGPNYIYISIDDYCNNSNNYFKAIYNDSINNNNIFARINLASVISSNGVYSVGGDDSFSTSLSRSREYFGPVNIQKMRITIYDEYGRVVILNNMDWSIGLMFECVYS
jgi:hypothetical protein